MYFEYVITLIISYLGLVAGNILAFLSPEELKPYKRYFRAAKYVLIFAMLCILFYGYKHNILMMLILALLIAGALLLVKNDVINYIVLAVIFFSAYKTGLSVIISALIFLFGMAVALKFSSKFMKKTKKIEDSFNGTKLTVISRTLSRYIIYIIVGVVLLFAL